MSAVFRMHVLPAQRGDALWIEYGEAGELHRILVDGGITRTGRESLRSLVAALPPGSHLDLLVVTHIDLDHIQGVLELLKRWPPHVEIDRVWFNGWDQLPRDPLEPQGVKQGIELSEVLQRSYAAAWNADAGGGPIGVAADGSPARYALPLGMQATVLGPDRDALLALKGDWEQVIEAFGASEDADTPTDLDPDAIAGLEPMGAGDIDVAELAASKFSEDRTVPNGSSIALMLEFAGARLLLLGDAHPTTVLRSLQRLSAAPLACDCVKLAHHGSRNNTSRALVQQLRSGCWVFSSNGAMTNHPNPEAVARVLHDSPGRKRLVFNYRTKYNEAWDDGALKDAHDYQASYGDGATPVVVDLLQGRSR